MTKAKPFTISKGLVWQAWLRVKANKGAAGVDGQSLTDFENNLGGNLYKLWNRMSSGSYFPPPVRRAVIKKKDGGTRPLGVPTVADRVAQTVVKLITHVTHSSSTEAPGTMISVPKDKALLAAQSGSNEVY